MTMNVENITKRSVGSIVNDDFSTANVFKGFGIDFCCGGAATLEDACRAAGVSVDDVVAALAAQRERAATAIPFLTPPASGM